MRSMVRTGAIVVSLLVVAAGCRRSESETLPQPIAAAKPAGPKSDKGVDLIRKILFVGALNDESGPGAGIGKPYALGKRILAARVNAGGSGLLPEGWKVQLRERDHGYNPQQAVQHYTALREDILFVATSFGTPNTLPLRELLERDGAVAFPASLSSQMAEHVHTPPLGPSYAVEAMRAMDFAVERAGGAAKVKAGIVYQQDDYGKDGLQGWQQAAKVHGVEIVAETTIAPGQKDFTAVITSLKEKGANWVLLSTLPSATGPILGTAAQLQYLPTWVGNTPAWIDAFFNEKVLPPAVLTNFFWVTGLPYWGEDVPGMNEFVAAFEANKPEGAAPDFYVLASYIQGLVELEAFQRALAAGDVSREGYLKAVRSIDRFDAGGLIQPVDLSRSPYVTSTRTRVLKPVLARRTWEQVSPYADPMGL